MAVLVRSGAPRSRRCARRSPRPASRSRWPATTRRWCASPPCCRCSTRCAPWSTSTTTTPTHATTSDPTGPRRCSVPARRARRDRRPRLARALRGREKERAGGPRPPVPRAAARAVLDPTLLDGSARPRRRRRAWPRCWPRPRRLDDGGTVEEVLWVLWQGTGWGTRLARPRAGGGRGPLAHRDLDAHLRAVRAAARPRSSAATPACELPRHAARPGDPGRHARRPRRPWRRRPAAHRPPLEGLEWRLVVVAPRAGGAWPDLRRRDSLLHADRSATAAAAAGSTRARCWPRSGGCSTSPAPVPASAWS
jgi:hypothetical protein